MKLSLKRGDINDIYKRIGAKHNISPKTVKQLAEKFFSKFIDNLDTLEIKEQERMIKLGLFRRLK